jgi:replicative DNA helicase
MQQQSTQQKTSLPLAVGQDSLRTEEAYLYDPGVERGVLACIMAHPDLLVEAKRTVKPEHFFYPMHQYTYRCMLFVAESAARNGWPISFDLTTVECVAKQAGPEFFNNFVQRTEGMAKWREIQEFGNYVDGNGFQRYVAALRDRAARVAIYRKARLMQIAAIDLAQHPSASEVAAQFGADLRWISHQVSNRPDPNLTDVFRDVMAYSDLVARYPFLAGLRIPAIPAINHALDGPIPQNACVLLAGTAKGGKSTLLNIAATDLAENGVPILFLDVEMTEREFVSRLTSRLSGVPEKAIRNGDLTVDQRASIREIEPRIAKIQQNFKLVNVAGKSCDEIISHVRQFAMEKVGTQVIERPDGTPMTVTNPGLVVYDYVKMPETTGNQSEYQVVGHLINELKLASNDTNVPVFAGIQMSQASIGALPIDVATRGESMIGNGMKPIQNSSALLVICGLNEEMQEAIGHQANVTLHCLLNRNGAPLREGQPITIKRETFSVADVPEPQQLMKAIAAESKRQRRAQAGMRGSGSPKATLPPREPMAAPTLPAKGA